MNIFQALKQKADEIFKVKTPEPFKAPAPAIHIFDKVQNILKGGVNSVQNVPVVNWLANSFIYNKETNRLFPQSPLYGIAESGRALDDYRAGKISKQDYLNKSYQATMPFVIGMSGGVTSKPSITNQLLRKSVPRGSFTNIANLDNPLVTGRGEITALENKLNDLVGFSKGGEHWKQQFHIRNAYIDEALTNAPANIKTQIKNIMNRLDELRKPKFQNVIPTPRNVAGTPVKSLPEIAKDYSINVKNKVHFLDYFRTPDRVLEKLGLDKEAKLLRLKYDDYLKELPVEIQRITKWSQQVVPDANQRIFQWLDGKRVSLAKNELKVAAEIKDYLGQWADRLKLPKEGRISNYISHIFEKGIEKEFDPEFAKLIRGKVAGSVYDPFLSKRTGKSEYIEDTWRALDAYVKRAVRKVHMDEALERVKGAAENLEDSQYKYVKSFVDRINLRPTDLDNSIDNLIKSSRIGYRFGVRPVTDITQKARRAVYRGLLGLNPMTAIKNLTQVVNTYSELGEKYTLIGYAKMLRNLPKFLTNSTTELEEVGVLREGFVQDRMLSSTQKFLQKTDDTLFYLFNLAEKINRGAAYFGAKSKAISEGLTEGRAIEYAKNIVRKTQFAFGSVDTPVVLQSDIAKTLLQFQSYSLKQLEFIGEKLQKKDLAGIIRYITGSLMVYTALGRTLGMKPLEQMIPSLRIGVPPTLQAPYGVYQGLTQSRDKFGNELSPQERILNPNLIRGLGNYIPAGAQLRKTIEGIKAINEKGTYSPSGRLKYPVEEGAFPMVFGPGKTEAGQQYYESGTNTLGPKQTERYKDLVAAGMEPLDAYQKIKYESQALKKQVEPTGEVSITDHIRNTINNLFNKNVQPETYQPEDPLIKAIREQKTQSDRETRIREIFKIYNTPAEIEKALNQEGLGSYDEASLYMLKTLEVTNGTRGEFIKRLLQPLSNADYVKTASYLIDENILTTGVVREWYVNDKIDTAQMNKLSTLIKQVKGTYKAKRVKGKRITIRPKKLNLPAIKVKSTKIKPMALKIKPLKPLKTRELKMPKLPKRLAEVNYNYI